LTKRLSHNYGTNLALPVTMQINFGDCPGYTVECLGNDYIAVWSHGAWSLAFWRSI